MGKIEGFYTMPHPPIIIPEVGKGEERKIDNTYKACVQVADEISKLKPDTIIIITPHGPLFKDAVAISNEDYVYGDLGQFGVPLVNMNLKVNTDLVDMIRMSASKKAIPVANIDEGARLDHGAIVPLYFINKKYTDYKIVHITYGMLTGDELYKFGQVIKGAVEELGSKAVMIASSDLSHKLKDSGPYEYSPAGPKFDKELISLLEAGDVEGVFNMDKKLVEEAGQCGLLSLYIMLGATDGYKVKGELLSYEGTFGVGYAVMKFHLSKEAKGHAKLARESLKYYLKQEELMPVPENTSKELTTSKRGVFVTINKFGNLRGCIGTIFPVTGNIAKEIIRNAVGAGTQDPRFPAITKTELKDLKFSVDVLTKPEKTSIGKLDPKKYGVIVTSGRKLGLLLPDLEGVDTAHYQLSIAMEKGGISPKEDYTIERFEVIRYEE